MILLNIICILGVYLIVGVATLVWHAFIGFGENDDTYDISVCLFWPIVIPIFLALNLNSYLYKITTERIDRKRKVKRLRLEFEQEEKNIIDQINRDLYEGKNKICP